jgi:menaquinone-9 beta-reductase
VSGDGAAVIVGGGPAGCAAAIRLADAGLPPVLLERSTEAVDTVCGDFLSAETIVALNTLGLDLAALKPAPISRLRLIRRDRVVEQLLPFKAAGLSRRVLDEALRTLVAIRGVSVRRGVTVQGIVPDGADLHVRSASPITTQAVFLGTGKHELRGLPRRSGRSLRRPGALGFKTYLQLTPAQRAALSDATELVLFPGGYAGLQPVEGGQAVLCLMVDHARFAGAGGWDSMLAGLLAGSPHLARRLDGSVALRERPVTIANVPYGYMAAGSPLAPGAVYRIGDQACVIPSLAGDGIAIALHSGLLAADAWRAGLSAAAYERRLATTLRGQMRTASWMHWICRHEFWQSAAMAVAASVPGVLPLAASWTRLPVAVGDDALTQRIGGDRKSGVAG